MLGFCGWALAMPAAVTLAVAWRAAAGRGYRLRRSQQERRQLLSRSACANCCPSSS
jgi:hypothetical protein